MAILSEHNMIGYFGFLGTQEILRRKSEMFRDSTKWKSLFSVSEIVSTKKTLVLPVLQFR